MSPLPPTRERPVTVRPSGAYPGGMSPNDGGEPPRRSRKWLKRMGVVFLVLFAVVLGAFAAVAFMAKQEIDDFVTANTAAEKATQGELTKPQAGKPSNILLLGSDHRIAEGQAEKAGSNSDTMLLVRLDPQKKTISMLSFPRDLYVPIPGHGQQKINAAYAEGGPALTVQTIKELTGLDVNFVMDVDFQGFRQIVDTFGGIYVDVDRHYEVAEGSGHSAIDIKPGYQRLRGKDGLAFARHRISDSDFNRIARQQQVLGALKYQVSTSGFSGNLQQLLKILKQNTSVVAGGGNEVPARVILDFIKLGLELDSKDIYQFEYVGGIGTAGEASIVELDQTAMDSVVKAFLSPNAEVREKTADQLVGTQSPEAGATKDETSTGSTDGVTPPAPSSVTITVRNGSGTNGAASTMAGDLRNAGYQVVGGQTNADNTNYANTRIQYRKPADKAAAQALATRIDGSSAEAATSSNPFDTKLLVIVGKVGTDIAGGDSEDANPAENAPDYEGNALPTKAAANVVTDLEYGRDKFAAAGSFKFPLMYPTVRPSGSTYDELHRYTLVKGKMAYEAYRLVGETSVNGEYWGLQGTAWPDPPILEGATREVTRGGRKYLLFFNGSRLHRVAWHQGAGTYWVENTIQNELSNETMLAVAAGVRPYR